MIWRPHIRHVAWYMLAQHDHQMLMQGSSFFQTFSAETVLVLCTIAQKPGCSSCTGGRHGSQSCANARRESAARRRTLPCVMTAGSSFKPSHNQAAAHAPDIAPATTH